VYYEIGLDVLFALSEATDGIANPPYVEKIGGGGEICKYLSRDFKAVYFISE
jgi:hypothetical protein